MNLHSLLLQNDHTVRKTLVNDIILVGGLAHIPGLRQRLLDELIDVTKKANG